MGRFSLERGGRGEEDSARVCVCARRERVCVRVREREWRGESADRGGGELRE